ncbi:hypothetical protein [Pseudooceanicola sp. 200-1SW]|uniref:hypothetical protein n=1 Tax=Pseudooceanicola sp. 200-1SW TaxID=3425949 RepID=UPI003D7F8595
MSGNGWALAGLGRGVQDRRNAARKRAWEAATARPDAPAQSLARLAGDEGLRACVAETGQEGVVMKATAKPSGPEMKLIVDGLCLDTLRFPAHLGDGASEDESRSWLDITRLRRADDGVPRLRDALLVALDWARDPEGNGRPEARQRLTLVIPTLHLPLEHYRAYARELELFTALVLRRYRDVVAAFEIGNEEFDLIEPEEYAAKARMAIRALETGMEALNLRAGERPDILLQMPLPPKPPAGRDDRLGSPRAAERAMQAALAARMGGNLAGTRAVATRFTAEEGAVEISAHEEAGRLVAYVRSRLDHPVQIDVDFAALLPGAPLSVEALRIGAATEAARPAAPRAQRVGNTLRLARPQAEAQPWALETVEMDGTLLDVELAPYEAVEVTFLLGDGSTAAAGRPPMRLLAGGQSGQGPRAPRNSDQTSTARAASQGLVGAPQPDEMIGWVGADKFVFGKAAAGAQASGPVVRNFHPGKDVIELVLPGLSVGDIALTDHADGVMVQAGDHARFLLDGVPSVRQIDVQRDFRVL